MARKKIGTILIEAGLIEEAMLHAALHEQKRWGGSVGNILVEMDAVDEVSLLKALSSQTGLPSIDLDGVAIDIEVAHLIPPEIADRYQVVPFRKEGKFLDVAMSDPFQDDVTDTLRIHTQHNIRPYMTGPKMIERALSRYYGRGPIQMGVATQTHGDAVIVNADGSQRKVVDATQRENVAVPVAVRVTASTPIPVAVPVTPSSPAPAAVATARLPEPDRRDAEIVNLQQRIAQLEALVARDENVLRSFMMLLIAKGVATTDEVRESFKKGF